MCYNSVTCRVIVTKRLQSSIHVRITLNMKFLEILWFSCTLATTFLSHTQKNIFQKQSNHVQDLPKRVNRSETGGRKLLRKQYFLLLMQKKVKKECPNAHTQIFVELALIGDKLYTIQRLYENTLLFFRSCLRRSN